MSDRDGIAAVDAVRRRCGPGWRSGRGSCCWPMRASRTNRDRSSGSDVSKPTVIAWKKRYAAEGIAGLDDRAKPGRPRVIDPVRIVLATLEPPPQKLGVTHWSSRLLAKHLGVSDFTVSHDLEEVGSGSRGGCRRSSSPPTPQLEAKIRDVVGSVSESAGAGDRAVCRREIPSSGPRSDRADAAAAARDARTSMRLFAGRS